MFQKFGEVAANVGLQKETMFVITVLLVALVAAIDAFAFENGAFATISQTWLSINRKHWWLTYLTVAFVGGLLQHLAVAQDPAHGLTPPFWRQALLWTPAFWVGAWVSWKWLYQLPNVD